MVASYRRQMALSLTILGATALGAQEAVPPAAELPTYPIERTAAAITVDGALEEEPWRGAPTFTLDYETRPGENVPPAVVTEFWLTHDDDRLYAAIRAHDTDPTRIRARLADRDRAFDDDFVGLVLDTFNDQTRGFEFFVNPLGVQMDLTQNDITGNEDDSWDAIWDSAGRLTEGGYEVELAIPFSSLRFSPAAGAQTWGIDAIRIRPRDARERIGLVPQVRGLNCYLCAIAKLTGFEGATPGRNLEFAPTLTATGSEERATLTDDLAGDSEAEPGVTVRWGVTPGINLNGTIHPDFSQVEADAAQLDVNTQFALFFPEKRPFFLEGADLFDTRIQAMYTRNIADPDWGAKVTGKSDANGFGAIVARDTITNLLLPGSDFSSLASLEEENVSTVLRYRRDLPGTSTVGVFYTDRSGDTYENRVLGIDTLLKSKDAWAWRIEALGSQTRYPDAFALDFGQPLGEIQDHALRTALQYQHRLGTAGVVLHDIGPEFRADLGFMPQVGFRRANPFFERYWFPEESRWTRFTLGGNGFFTDDPDGEPLERRGEIYAVVDGPLQSYLWVTLGGGERTFQGTTFDDNWVNFDLEARPAKPVWTGLEARVGDQIDFANARPGEVTQLRPEVDLDLGRHLRLELDHTWAALDVDGGKLFDVHLSEARATYQLNVRTFVRLLTQYEDVSRNTDLFTFPVEARSKNWFNQVLFSYKLNPQTVLFLGYSDAYRTPFLGEALPAGNTPTDLEQQSRGLFFKIGYAWVL